MKTTKHNTHEGFKAKEDIQAFGETLPITQVVEIPADRMITIKVPPQIPAGRVILSFTPEIVDDCPLCAKYRDPETGELRFNEETVAAMQEVDDMLAGKIPNTLKKFNSLEEMLDDLDSDD